MTNPIALVWRWITGTCPRCGHRYSCYQNALTDECWLMCDNCPPTTRSPTSAG